MELFYSMIGLWPIMAVASIAIFFVGMLVRPSNDYRCLAPDGTRGLDAAAVKEVAWKAVIFGLLTSAAVWAVAFLTMDLA